MAEYILVINPGSTSTKVAVFDGEKEVHSMNIDHPAEELKKFVDINEQLPFRKVAVMKYLESQSLKPSDLAGIAARAGAIGQLESGAYLIDETFVNACRTSQIPHPANLSPIIAYEIAEEAGTGICGYAYDAVCGCGVPDPIFTYTGVPEIKKPFFTHVLNSRAVSIEQAKKDGMKLEDTTYIVCHLGGGVTSNLIKGGKVLDFVGDDEGGFSPERSGGVPCRELVKFCFRSGLSEKEVQKKLKGQGGLTAYLGVNDARDVERMAFEEGNEEAKLVYDAMIMQLSKDIASLAPVVCGKVDKIILTGGMAYSSYLTAEMEKRVSFIAPVSVSAGTYEMEALAKGIHRVLAGEEQAQVL
ncbi:butyrate kinase [Senimuribacter intestinalis]|uniref:butyrate kinase n=1 Tax=Senimuribacter intestinalis TaxID=2941507 RepID=UPI0020406583|nr:butyrate kinase [Senimuribacter intestinalis]